MLAPNLHRRSVKARGVPKWVLWAGVVITMFFVVLALFAPWIAPYDFDEYRTATGERFGKQQLRPPTTRSGRTSSAPTCCRA